MVERRAGASIANAFELRVNLFCRNINSPGINPILNKFSTVNECECVDERECEGDIIVG